MADSQALRVETDLAVTMRDGTVLRADLYRPDGPGPYPVLLQRTPYDKTAPGSMLSLDPLKSAKRGYATVIQDVRGRYASQGEFYAFRDEIDDGYDTVEWAAAQPWSSGKVGMYGASYVGATQWLAALSQPPHLTTIVPNVTASNYHEGWTYQGGAFELGFNVSWTVGQLTLANLENLGGRLGLSDQTREDLVRAVDGMEETFRHLPMADLPHLKGGLADYFYDWLAHPEYDDYWKALSIEENHSRLNVPAYHIGGWYDIFLGGTIRNYLGMREKAAGDEGRRGQRMLVGPWVHGSRSGSTAGSHYFGVAADAVAVDLDGLHYQWYDHWLKGIDNGIMERAAGPDIRHGGRRLAFRGRVAPCPGPVRRLLPSTAGAARTPCGATAASARRLPVTSRRTCSCTTRPTRRQPGEAPCAATRTSCPTAPSTRATWRRGRTCWSTPLLPWQRRWR